MDDCQSLMKDVFKRVAERALQAEVTQYLGYASMRLQARILVTAVTASAARPLLLMMVM